jgi:hypothetical protein
VPAVVDGVTAVQNRRRDPVFRTVSALCLLIGLQELLNSFPSLPQPVGVLWISPGSAELVTRLLVAGLAVPLAYVICGALMLLRRSAAAALFAVLVASLELLTYADLAISGWGSAALLLLPALLVLVMGIWAVRVSRSPVRS